MFAAPVRQTVEDRRSEGNNMVNVYRFLTVFFSPTCWHGIHIRISKFYSLFICFSLHLNFEELKLCKSILSVSLKSCLKLCLLTLQLCDNNSCSKLAKDYLFNFTYVNQFMFRANALKKTWKIKALPILNIHMYMYVFCNQPDTSSKPLWLRGLPKGNWMAATVQPCVIVRGN